jgi:hypothetical protein
MAQGGYYVATGLIPFVSRRAFEAVTGPKREWWLVETVAGLVVAVGVGVLSAALRARPSSELLIVAGGSALTLAGVDVVYVSRGRIAPTYLIDAGAQIGTAVALAVSIARESAAASTSQSVSRPVRVPVPGTYS